MEDMQQINWSCIEITKTKKRFIGTQLFPLNNVGDIVGLDGHEGELLASSTMGVTLFDLFGEIVSQTDLNYFLSQNGIIEEFNLGAIVLRSFLLLLELNGLEINSGEHKSSQQSQNVNSEEIKKEFEEISNEETNIEVCVEEDNRNFEEIRENTGIEPIRKNGDPMEIEWIEEDDHYPDFNDPEDCSSPKSEQDNRDSRKRRARNCKRKKSLKESGDLFSSDDESKLNDSKLESRFYSGSRPKDPDFSPIRNPGGDVTGEVEEIPNPHDSDKEFEPTNYAKRKLLSEKREGKRKYKKHQKVNIDGPILDDETGQILGDADDQDDSNYRVEVSYYKGKNGKTYGPYKTKVRRQTVSHYLCRANGCKCDLKFSRKKDRDQHYLDIGCYNCEKCLIKYPTLLLLNTHKLHFCQNKQYPETERPPEPATEEEINRLQEVYKKQCRFQNCGRLFETEKEKLAHEKTFMHYKCEHCQEQFFKLPQYTAHRLTCLDLVCDNCGKDFRSEVDKTNVKGHHVVFQRAKQHMRGCKNEQSHICHDCGRSYNHPSSLNRHLQKAHGVIRRMTKVRNPKSTENQNEMLLDNGDRPPRNDPSEATSPSKQPRKQKAPKSTNQLMAERLATNQIAENIVYELGEPSMLNPSYDPDLIWKQGLLNRAYYNL